MLINCYEKGATLEPSASVSIDLFVFKMAIGTPACVLTIVSDFPQYISQRTAQGLVTSHILAVLLQMRLRGPMDRVVTCHAKISMFNPSLGLLILFIFPCVKYSKQTDKYSRILM